MPSAQRSPAATTAASPPSAHRADEHHSPQVAEPSGATSLAASQLSRDVGRVVLDADDISRALTRIAHEILERNKGSKDVILLGIPSRGTPLAHRIATTMSRVEDADVAVGSLDITMYRDDLRLRPARALGATDIPPRGVDGAVVVLVDDVLFSGRTIRAALDALNDVGRPQAVQLAVLVDRGHRELPIRADFVGKNLPTSLAERVHVWLREYDGTDPDLRSSATGTVATGRPDSVVIAAPEGSAS